MKKAFIPLDSFLLLKMTFFAGLLGCPVIHCESKYQQAQFVCISEQQTCYYSSPCILVVLGAMKSKGHLYLPSLSGPYLPQNLGRWF